MTRRKGRSGRRGFALITVIWGLSIIALLIVSFMTTARLRLQTAYNLAGATRAGLIADAALGATFMALLAEREVPVTFAHQPPHDGAPKFCAIDDAAVSVSLEEETGKIDLNGATPNLLGAMLVGFGLDPPEADRVAAAIVAFRAPAQSAQAAEQDNGDKPFPPKHGLYQSVLELDQVGPMTPELFATIRSFVTVHSRSPGLRPPLRAARPVRGARRLARG